MKPGLAALILFAVFLPALPSASARIVAQYEDYEKFSYGQVASESWYQPGCGTIGVMYSPSGCATISSTYALGQQSSVVTQSYAPGSRFAYWSFQGFDAANNFCNAVPLQVAALVHGTGTAGQTLSFAVGMPSTNPLVWNSSPFVVSASMGGSFSLQIGGDNSVQTATFGTAILLEKDQFYTLELTAHCFGTQYVDATLTRASDGTEEYIHVPIAIPFSTIPASKAQYLFVMGSGPSSSDKVDFYIDNLGIQTTIASPVRSVNVPNLTGFDVDPYNGGIIVRSDGGHVVRAYDPVTLLQVGRYNTTNCARLDGVAALYSLGREFLTFLDCGSDTRANAIRIRSATLAQPDHSGTICEGQDFCDTDIESDSGTPLPPGFFDMGRIQAVKWDWQTGSDEGPDHSTLAWAYSDIETGEIGVFAYTQTNNNPDEGRKATLVYSPSSGLATDQICSWPDYTNPQSPVDRLAAVRQSGPTRAFNLHVGDEPYNGRWRPVVSITPASPPSSSLDHAVGIGCGLNRAFVLTDDGHATLLNITDPGQGHIASPRYEADATPRGIALSLNGMVGAYIHGGLIHIINFTANREVDTIPLPAGTLRLMQLSFVGARLYVATNLGFTVADISLATNTYQTPEGTLFDPKTGHRICSPCDVSGGQNVNPDTDEDTLPDAWEYSHFGNLTYTADDDPDGDGYTNHEEYNGGTEVTNPADHPIQHTETVTETNTAGGGGGAVEAAGSNLVMWGALGLLVLVAVMVAVLPTKR